jgi:hypothetical protein
MTINEWDAARERVRLRLLGMFARRSCDDEAAMMDLLAKLSRGEFPRVEKLIDECLARAERTNRQVREMVQQAACARAGGGDGC